VGVDDGGAQTAKKVNKPEEGREILERGDGPGHGHGMDRDTLPATEFLKLISRRGDGMHHKAPFLQKTHLTPEKVKGRGDRGDNDQQHTLIYGIY
jgi:hypothetical protein